MKVYARAEEAAGEVVVVTLPRSSLWRICTLRPQDAGLLWKIGDRPQRPERSHFLKISVRRRHTTPLRTLPQRSSILRRTHKRAARTATTPRQAAKVQPVLRAYATKGTHAVA